MRTLGKPVARPVRRSATTRALLVGFFTAALSSTARAEAGCRDTLELRGPKAGVVISQQAYAAPVTTAHNDAQAIARQLAANGYQVGCFKDLNGKSLQDIARTLADKARDYEGDLFVYLTGYGWSDGAGSYFLGIDYSGPKNAGATAVELDRLARELSGSRARQVVLILDTSRTPPGSDRTAAARWPALQQTKNMIIAVAGTSGQQPGSRYSVFGGLMAGYMTPGLGLSVQEMLERVAMNVRRRDPRQIPSFVSFSARSLFLDTRATGLKGLRTADDLPSIGATSPAILQKEAARRYKSGLVALFKEELSKKELDCRDHFQELLGKPEPTDQVEIRGLPNRPDTPKGPAEPAIVIAVTIGDACAASMNGNSDTYLLGWYGSSDTWKTLLKQNVLAIWSKPGMSGPEIIAERYAGSGQIDVMLFQYVDGKGYLPLNGMELPAKASEKPRLIEQDYFGPGDRP